MKKILVLAAVLALLVWIVSWFRVPAVVATAAAHPWPNGLGTLETVAQRFPPLEANDAAKKLIAMANALPKNEASDEFVSREIARGEIAIGAVPPIADATAMRDLLLRERIVWKRTAGIGEVGDQQTSSMRTVQMTVARALVASALSKARANDAAAWEDLRAVWNLARSLEPQPQMMSQTAAFAMARMINALAWKLPLPTPPWFAEVQQRDDIRPLIAAFQYQAASYWKDGAQMFPTKWLADSVEHDRAIAESLARETRCDVQVPMNQLGVDLSSIWRRAFRTRAEREATANALRIREGKPIEPKSRCTGGTWTFDGTTLRFNQEIPTAAPDRPMPLALKVKG